MPLANKFQVGDIVRIRPGCIHWNREMYGVKCEITKIRSNGRVDIKLLETVDLHPSENQILKPGFEWYYELPNNFDLVSRFNSCCFVSLL